MVKKLKSWSGFLVIGCLLSKSPKSRSPTLKLQLNLKVQEFSKEKYLKNSDKFLARSTLGFATELNFLPSVLERLPPIFELVQRRMTVVHLIVRPCDAITGAILLI